MDALCLIAARALFAVVVLGALIGATRVSVLLTQHYKLHRRTRNTMPAAGQVWVSPFGPPVYVHYTSAGRVHFGPQPLLGAVAPPNGHGWHLQHSWIYLDAWFEKVHAEMLALQPNS